MDPNPPNYYYWREKLREHLSLVNNLLIGYATASIAFVFDYLTKESASTKIHNNYLNNNLQIIFGYHCLCWSLLSGTILVVFRLIDYLITQKKLKGRKIPGLPMEEKDFHEVSDQTKWCTIISWSLFVLQIGFLILAMIFIYNGFESKII